MQQGLHRLSPRFPQSQLHPDGVLPGPAEFRPVRIVLLVVLLCAAALGQDRVNQALDRASACFAKGDLRQGVALVNEALGRLDDSGGTLRGSTPASVAANCVNYLYRRAEKARVDLDGNLYLECVFAAEPLLHSLISWEESNPRWYYMRAIMWMARGGQFHNMTYIKLAIKDLDSAMRCPGSEPYQASCQALKANCQREIKRARAELAELLRKYPPAAEPSTGMSDFMCSKCHRWSKSDNYRCGLCGGY